MRVAASEGCCPGSGAETRQNWIYADHLLHRQQSSYPQLLCLQSPSYYCTLQLRIPSLKYLVYTMLLEKRCFSFLLCKESRGTGYFWNKVLIFLWFKRLQMHLKRKLLNPFRHSVKNLVVTLRKSLFEKQSQFF